MRPDYVMGHSLGEYGALVAAGVMPFADALEAVRGPRTRDDPRQLRRQRLDGGGRGPLDVVEKVLASIDGYVVTANLNSRRQAVIGGETAAVRRAIEALERARASRPSSLPVSHAFHTRIVAPAAEPLGQVLDRLRISPPRLPIVANVTPVSCTRDPPGDADLLVQQIASPVQWVRGLETLWREGVRTFVEVGPKNALKGFADDVLGGRDGLVTALHQPSQDWRNRRLQPGALRAVRGRVRRDRRARAGRCAIDSEPRPPRGTALRRSRPCRTRPSKSWPRSSPDDRRDDDAPRDAGARQPDGELLDRNRPPAGSVVITGCGLGLPGTREARHGSAERRTDPAR